MHNIHIQLKIIDCSRHDYEVIIWTPSSYESPAAPRVESDSDSD